MSNDRSHSFVALVERDPRYSEYVTNDLRGVGVAELLTRFTPPGPNTKVLDVGCGSGLLSFALAARYATVVAGDRQPDNVDLTVRGRNERGFTNLHITTLDGLKLPFADGSFDAAVVNGVLEWVGANDIGEDPAVRQDRFLHEIRRVLRPGSILYLAIENRYALAHLIREPHTKRLLVSILPRKLASVLSAVGGSRPFQVYIYGPSELRSKIEASGFEKAEIFMPVLGYQYPFEYVSLSSKSRALEDIRAIDLRRLNGLLHQVRANFTAEALTRKLRRRATLRVLRMTARDLACIARVPS
jgi:SAM-dependent methyltransferase